MPGLTLTGYRHSVYTCIARMALHERGLAYATVEADPFADPPPPALATLTPFGRVPVLSHGEFVLYETAAILRYLDLGFPGPSLVPSDPRAAARMAQVVGITDHLAYWPMVRQVFSQRVFSALIGRIPDEAIITDGLRAARPVLAALDGIAAEGHVLGTGTFTLADIHLAPMIAYFVRAPEGARALAAHPALCAWWARLSQRGSLSATLPAFPVA